MNYVELKPFEYSDDMELLCEWCQKEHVYQWFEQRKLSKEELYMKYQKKMEDGGQHLYIILYRHQKIGFMQYYLSDYKTDSSKKLIEYDLFIGEEDYLHKGYGVSIISFINQFIFQKEKVDCILLRVFLRNTIAIHCYEKSGFHKLDQYQGVNTIGEEESICVYHISKEDCFVD